MLRCMQPMHTQSDVQDAWLANFIWIGKFCLSGGQEGDIKIEIRVLYRIVMLVDAEQSSPLRYTHILLHGSGDLATVFLPLSVYSFLVADCHVQHCCKMRD